MTIEFRAWHDEWKEMVYSSDSMIFDKRCFAPFIIDIGFSHYPEDDKWKFMLWSGLTDMNNSKIYLSDYFDTEDGLMEVFFIDGKFILMWADNGTYRCDLCDAVKTISKCGNKYENPELLNLI